MNVLFLIAVFVVAAAVGASGSPRERPAARRDEGGKDRRQP